MKKPIKKPVAVEATKECKDIADLLRTARVYVDSRGLYPTVQVYFESSEKAQAEAIAWKFYCAVRSICEKWGRVENARP